MRAPGFPLGAKPATSSFSLLFLQPHFAHQRRRSLPAFQLPAVPPSKPLPDCEGPKLECFIEDLEAHNFKFLAYVRGGCHGAVFKAEIDGKLYAIKFFSTPNINSPCENMAPLYIPYDEDEHPRHVRRLKKESELKFQSESTKEIFTLHSASFYCECRAYGRLKELGREDLAVRAYGYMRVYLTDKVEQQFKEVIQKSPWPGTQSMAQLLNHDNPDEPVMAIVKDWLSGEEGTDDEKTQKAAQASKHFPRMLRNLRDLHKCGIVVRDIQAQQYIDGILVDFSFAWTIPHVCGPEGDILPPWAFASMAAADLCFFQVAIIDAWNREDRMSLGTWRPPGAKHCRLVAYKNAEKYRRLRPRVDKQRPFLPLVTTGYGEVGYPMHEFPPYDPALFDWRAIKKQTKKGKKETVASKRKEGPQTQSKEKQENKRPKQRRR